MFTLFTIEKRQGARRTGHEVQDAPRERCAYKTKKQTKEGNDYSVCCVVEREENVETK